MKREVLINLLGVILLISGFIFFIAGFKLYGGILSFSGIIVYLVQRARTSKA